MKKTIMFLGMLSLGLAQAQQYDGKVGVNTETPNATLNVKSKKGTTSATKNFELQNAADKKLVTVLDNGNVGINNDKPSYLLDIIGTDNSYIRNSMALRGFRTDGSIGIDLYKARGGKDAPAIVEQNDLVGHLGFSTYNGAKYMSSGSMVGRVTGDITPDKAVPVSLDFRVVKDFADANISNDNVAMRVYHDGNIGMGTIVPTHKLHIKPDAGKDPLKLEGLQSTTDATAKNLVVVDGVVKIGNASNAGTGGASTDSEWKYDDATKRIKLNRSGQGTFTNEVFYNSTNGVSYDVDGGLSTTVEALETVVKNGVTTPHITPTPLSDIHAGQVYFRESQSIPTGIFTKQDGDKVYSKTFVSEGYRLGAKDNTNYDNIFGKRSGVSIESDNANDYSNATVYGSYNGVFANGTRSVKNINGSYNTIIINGTQSVDDAVTSASYFTRIQTQGRVKRAVGLTGAIGVASNTTQAIDDIRGGNFYVDIDPNTPALIKSMTGMIASANTSSTNTGVGGQLRGALIQAINKGNTKYTNQIALLLVGTASKTSLPTYHYGLKINNIEGSELGAYAIHTSKGKVSLGDEVEVKSTIKVADNTKDTACTPTKAGTIRFVAGTKKFQGCTGTEWKDLHN